MIKKIKQFARAHKFFSTIIVVVVVGGGYYWYRSTQGAVTVTKYVVQAATQGTVVASVSGSGQVQPVTTINVNSQGGSGDVTSIAATVGQSVTQGQLLMQIDPTNEEKAVEEAQLNLQSAQLALAKLQEAPATTTLQQDEDSVTQAQQNLVEASTTLGTDYQGGYDSLSQVFVDLQNTVAELQNFVLGKDINKIQNDPDAFVSLLPSYLQPEALPYRDNVESTYSVALAAYQQNFTDYQTASRNSSPATLDALFAETLNTAKDMSDAVTASKSLITNIIDNYPSSSSTSPLPPITNTYSTSFGNYTETVNNDITNITNIQNTIQSDETAITNDNLSLTVDQDSLTALQGGPDTLDVQSQQISIQNSQISLQTAEQNLANDSVRAPIAGVVASIPAIVGEPAPSTAATIVTNSDVALVTLNEIEAAKVNLGDESTLTFDALPDLSLAGQVVEIDPVGTVSQGVVNFNAEIAFQDIATSSDESVKPGMSVTANIVTQVDQNVVAVPNAAVVTEGTATYILEPATAVSTSSLAASASGGVVIPQGTKMVPVTVGLSNDTLTEITSGVNVGDQIIVQTIKSSGSAGAATSGGTSALRLLGGGGAGGGGGFGGGAGRAGGGGGVL